MITPAMPSNESIYGPEIFLGIDVNKIRYDTVIDPNDLDAATAECLNTFEDRILYEDDGMIVVNKHPGVLAHRTQDPISIGLLEITQELRPYDDIRTINRLDRLTSGIMLMGKRKSTTGSLAKQFQEKDPTMLDKSYLAVISGTMEGHRYLDLELEKGEYKTLVRPERTDTSKQAVSIVVPLAGLQNESGSPQTLVSVQLVTGRMHQIRASLASIGHPIDNDYLYRSTKRASTGRMKLHSHMLAIIHPTTREQMFFVAEPPEDMFEGLYSYRDDAYMKQAINREVARFLPS